MAALCVMVSAPADVAQHLARGVVENRLAACVQCTPVQSTYRWEDAVEQAEETLLLIKTEQGLYKELEAWLRAEHPYEIPEILALPITEGHAPYLNWLHANLREH